MIGFQRSRHMIGRRKRQFPYRAKSIHFRMPVKTIWEQSSTRAARSTRGLVERSRFDAAETESLQQRQRVIVWLMMAFVWILSLIATIILWNKASSEP